MLSTVQARAAARSARLAAAREYASEVVQNVELQVNVSVIWSKVKEKLL